MNKLLPFAMAFAFACNTFVNAQVAPPQSIASAASETEKKLAAMPVEELISMLQEESKPGMGTDPLARCDPGDFRFQGGAFHPERQTVSPVMHELISRGINALPALIAHITDTRPTKLTIGETLPGGDKLELWLASGYDARDHRPSKEREGISTDPYSIITYKQVHQYTLKVGDFCYVAIGQIVNRDLNALRYMASLQVVINTPVEVRVLATAVKADWGELTPEDHEKSLEEDALRRCDIEALKMLSLYYPKSFDAPAVKLLNRSMFAQDQAWEFINKSLVPEKDTGKRLKLLTQFHEKNGDTNYLGILKNLIWASTYTITLEKDAPVKVASNQVLAEAFPDVEPYDPPFINAVNCGNQQTLVENLSAIPSKAVDEAVAGLLQRASAMPLSTATSDSISIPGLVHACSQRLMEKPEYEPVVRSSLEKVILNLRKAWEPQVVVSMGFSGANYIKILQDMLNKLPAKPARAPVKPVEN